MTAARQVLPGTTYLVTRRCSERRFFLKPSKKTNAIFRYVLAAVANRYGIRVHVYCVLSNHFHLVLTDPDGRLPDFHRDLDALIARAMNRALGRWENFWDPDSYSAVRLADPAAILEKMVYVLANPVAAGLVRRCADWPGSWSDPALIGRDAVAVDRPCGFFREKGPLPAAARLQLHMPPGFDADGALADVLRDLLREAEERAATELARGGRAFVGAARILAQRPTAPLPLSLGGTSALASRPGTSGSESRRSPGSRSFETPIARRWTPGERDCAAFSFRQGPGSCASTTASVAWRPVETQPRLRACVERHPSTGCRRRSRAQAQLADVSWPCEPALARHHAW